ncbi:MAG: recombination mediator RecR [Spirochaetota bacterium]
MNALERTVEYFSRLPGIGKKSATRIAYHLLKTESGFAQGLAKAITELKERIRPCRECGVLTEQEVCSFCTDTTRDRTVICVVEEPQDVSVIEETREFRGLYHVLHGVISPMDGIGPEELGLNRLFDRVRELGVAEVVVATNPTVEGDTTALYLARELQSRDVRTTRLALGLPVGGDLEYADRLTLARSFRGRTPLNEF